MDIDREYLVRIAQEMRNALHDFFELFQISEEELAGRRPTDRRFIGMPEDPGTHPSPVTMNGNVVAELTDRELREIVEQHDRGDMVDYNTELYARFLRGDWYGGESQEQMALNRKRLEPK